MHTFAFMFVVTISLDVAANTEFSSIGAIFAAHFFCSPVAIYFQIKYCCGEAIDFQQSRYNRNVNFYKLNNTCLVP